MVTLSDVTRTGVLAAVAEFDRLGRQAFFKSTRFSPVRTYFGRRTRAKLGLGGLLAWQPRLQERL